MYYVQVPDRDEFYNVFIRINNVILCCSNFLNIKIILLVQSLRFTSSTMFGHALHNFFFCKCKVDVFEGLIADRHITLTNLNCINKLLYSDNNDIVRKI